MQQVVGGIAQLLRRQLGRSPVGGLLLLGQLDAEQIAAEILMAAVAFIATLRIAARS
jgi:hypothetical protein